MHIRCVIGIVGYLIMFLGIAIIPPIIATLIYQEEDFLAFLISAVTATGIGFVLARLFHDPEVELNIRDGFLIVFLGWIGMSIISALPFLLSGEIPFIVDAWFEAVSGITTTGSTVIEDVEVLPHGILLWRSMIQWIGGMGIIVLSIALLPLLGVGGLQLYKAEVPGPTIDKVRPRVRDTAVALWKVYLLFTVSLMILYVIGGMSLFDAVCHGFTTMATGGYSTKNASIGGFESTFIIYVAIIFMFIAGTNFTLHYRYLHGDFRSLLRSTEFRWYSGIAVGATLFVTLSTRATTFDSYAEAFKHSAFQVVSILTTTGYGTFDYELWAPAVQFLILLFMFIGGMAGSTAGGLKTIRGLLLVKNMSYEIKRILHPKAIIPITVNRQRITQDIMNEVMAFVFIYITVFIFTAILLSVTGLGFISSVGATASAIGNVGPGLGSVGPTATYAHLEPIAKFVLTICMILGRLEIFTVLIIFYRWFWKR